MVEYATVKKIKVDKTANLVKGLVISTIFYQGNYKHSFPMNFFAFTRVKIILFFTVWAYYFYRKIQLTFMFKFFLFKITIIV